MKSSVARFSGAGKTHIAWLRVGVCTFLALTAFASNSIICRLALGAGAIDAAGFTAVRLASGALMLLPIAAVINRRKRERTYPGS